MSVKKSRIDRDIYLRELTLLKKQISNMESRYNNVLKENQFLWKTFMNSKKQQDEMKRQMERICKFISKLTTSNRILDNSDDLSQYVRFHFLCDDRRCFKTSRQAWTLRCLPC